MAEILNIPRFFGVGLDHHQSVKPWAFHLQDWQEALQRFGHCFRRTGTASEADPRFVAEAVDREVQRIDGEFQDGLSAGLRRGFFF